MSDRFYDENRFFSSEMLIGRGNSTTYVWDDLMPAFEECVRTHFGLARGHRRPSGDMEDVLAGQKLYDEYSSVRDPAHGLLSGMFGRAYADEFVYDVLFPLSDGIPETLWDRR